MTLNDLETFDKLDFKIRDKINTIINAVSELMEDLEERGMDFVLDMPSSYIDYDVSLEPTESGIWATFVYEAPYEDLYDERIRVFFGNHLLMGSVETIKEYYDQENTELHKVREEQRKEDLLRAIKRGFEEFPELMGNLRE